MRFLVAALLLAACAPAPPPAAPGPQPSAIVFSQDAVGPESLAGGAVVIDPGNACPGAEIRVVGAGLPPGQVAIEGPGGLRTEPQPLKVDGSFDARVRLPASPAGGELAVRHGDARAAFPLSACTPVPVPSGSRLPTFTP